MNWRAIISLRPAAPYQPLSRPALSAAMRPRGARAFTLTELLVVISIIVIILSVAVPALSSISRQSRENASAQLLNVMVTRAFYTAIATRSQAAVRFVPGAWDFEESRDRQNPAGRQHMAIFRLASSTENPVSKGPQFYERFVRLEKSESVPLPENVWAAPIEALSRAPVRPACACWDGSQLPDNWRTVPNEGEYILTGRPGIGSNGFALSETFCWRECRVRTSSLGPTIATAPPSSYSIEGDFLNADDFMIVVDANAGVLPKFAEYPLFAFDPIGAFQLSIQAGTVGVTELSVERTPKEWDSLTFPWNSQPIIRYGFTGVALYDREVFLAQGKDASAQTALRRQDFLIRASKPYLPYRTGGGIAIGAPATGG